MVTHSSVPGIGPQRFKFETRSLTPAASAHLDLIRASAAWAVLWGHVRALFFIDFQHLPYYSWWLGGIYFITGFGHQAVMVFFVLSGFLISASIMRKHSSGRWSTGEYALDRATRLYAVLIPGLLLGFMWDEWGRWLFAPSGLYSQPLAAFGAIVPQNQLTISNFVGNLFFLQTILCATFGSNGPLWSLANEFWYYILFPLGFFAVLAWKKSQMRLAMALAILALCVAGFIGEDMLLGFFVWLAGFALVLTYSRFPIRGKASLMRYLAVASLGLLVCLGAARKQSWGPLGSDLFVGLTFAIALFGVLQADFGKPNKHYARTARFFSGFSYSLYVLHFPLLLFLRGWLSPLARWQPDPIHLTYGLFIGTLVIGFCWVVSIFTENKTSFVRDRLKSHIASFGDG